MPRNKYSPGYADYNGDGRPNCLVTMEWELKDGRFSIDPSKPPNAYGKHFPGQRQDSWNLLGWVRPDEHPAGLLGKPCPICGYKYGTAWKREDIPADIVAEIISWS